MNLNPKSPFSDRHLNDLTGEHVREGDAWCYSLLDKGYEIKWMFYPLDNKEDWMVFFGEGWYPVTAFASWHTAGPLMETQAWIDSCFQLCNNGVWKSFEVHEKDRLFRLVPIAILLEKPLAIRNSFIIAATHAASIAAGKE